MSNLYSVIPALTPSASEIVEAELLAKQVLEAEFPTLDLREGTGLRDLVLRPTAYAMALLKKANDYYFAGNTITGANDTTDQEIVDDILSNWFVTRNLGTNAVIDVRMFFARSKNVTIPSSAFFSTDGELKFYPASTLTFQASDLSYDSYQNEYYVDIQLVAESPGISYNIGEGSLLYFSTFDTYFLHGEINYLAQASTDPETNTQFISRTSNAISTRNLINRPSILSNLQSNFNMLDRIFVKGYGDPGMIRDQLKAVFDPEAPRTLTSLYHVSGLATATLANHGYEVGQTITLRNALPTEYNSSFVITAITANTFNFNVSPGISSVTQLPNVQSSTPPAWIHMGGKVDVYCGDEVSTSLIQLTTDSNGVAYLSGPVLSFVRSPITGGVDDDTIPYQRTLPIQSSSLPGSGVLSITTTTPHNLAEGDAVNVSGFTQTLSITSLNCENLLVTAVCPNHGLTTGTKVTISGATPVDYNGTYNITRVDSNTFTYVTSVNILTSATGTLIATNPTVASSFPIVYTGIQTFNIVFPVYWTNGTNTLTGLAITQNTQYTTSYSNRITKTLTSLTSSGTVATVILENHGYTEGRYVTIDGASPSTYNGTFRIQTVTANSFTYNMLSTPASSTASGTITSTATDPSKDFGFSTRQVLEINFGSGYANSTATFEIRYFTYIDDVQTYLELTNVHVLCGDYLARGYNVYMLDINASVYDVSAPTSGLVSTTAATYLKTLSPGNVLVLSDLVTALTNAGITNLQTPLGVDYTYYNRDLITPVTGTIVDYLDPVDDTNIFLVNSVTTQSLATQ
jgi:hypothetical protein